VIQSSLQVLIVLHPVSHGADESSGSTLSFCINHNPLSLGEALEPVLVLEDPMKLLALKLNFLLMLLIVMKWILVGEVNDRGPLLELTFLSLEAFSRSLLWFACHLFSGIFGCRLNIWHLKRYFSCDTSSEYGLGPSDYQNLSIVRPLVQKHHRVISS